MYAKENATKGFCQDEGWRTIPHFPNEWIRGTDTNIWCMYSEQLGKLLVETINNETLVTIIIIIITL